MRIEGFLSARGAGVRQYRLLAPSVGCVNRTVEGVSELDPELRVLTHQHGCGMLDDDVAQFGSMLAGVFCNPNVVSGVVVGLGCESNQASAVRDLATANGGAITSVVLQEHGGVESTRRAVLNVAEVQSAPRVRTALPLDAVRVAVLCQASSETATAAANQLSRSLADVGLQVAGPLMTYPGGVASSAGLSVPEVWATGERIHQPTDVETLSLAASQGVVLAVSFSDDAMPIGSPVMPVVRVSTSPGWAHMADFRWLTDDGPAMSGLLALIEEVANGRPTAGERLGQRDFAPPRVAPTM